MASRLDLYGLPREVQRPLEQLLELIPQGFYAGTGSPENVVTAPVGSLYRRFDGGASTTLYVKESGTGNTGWVAK